jgi:hypothetical protein
MILLIAWVFGPLADWAIDARSKAQLTVFAVLVIVAGVIADYRDRQGAPNGDSEPKRFAGIELRAMTSQEKATVPKVVLAVAFILPLAVLLTLGDSWVGLLTAMAVSGIAGLAVARYAQQRGR